MKKILKKCLSVFSIYQSVCPLTQIVSMLEHNIIFAIRGSKFCDRLEIQQFINLSINNNLSFNSFLAINRAIIQKKNISYHSLEIILMKCEKDDIHLKKKFFFILST